MWIAALVLLGAVAAWWWYFLKFRVVEVVPGAFYRSPQVSARRLAEVIDSRGVDVVLNLRGTGRGGTWYGEEKRVCAEAGVEHRTVTFDMDAWPPRQRVVEMLEVLDSADGPILAHCLRGVDRAGWASAVAVLAAGGSFDEAMLQLSVWSGHLCRREGCPQHRFFDLYRRHLEARGASSSAQLFRTWIEENYCLPDSDAEVEILSPLPGRGVPEGRVDLRVRVENRGASPWRLGPDGVRLGVRAAGPFAEVPEELGSPFRSGDTGCLDLGRSDFDEKSLPTKGEASVDLSFRLPKQRGIYVLQVNLLRESIHWFSDVGRLGRVWVIVVGSAPSGETREGSQVTQP